MKYSIFLLLTMFSVTLCAAGVPSDKTAQDKAKQEIKAKQDKDTAEKAKQEAKVAAEKAKQEAKAKQEKAKLEAKVAAENAKLEAKAKQEKAKLEAKKAAELQKKVREEIAKVTAEMDPLLKDLPADLKKNDLKAAAEKADKLIKLCQFVACDGKTGPRYNAQWVFERVILPGFSGKKLSAAEYTKKYYEQYAAILQKSGKAVPYAVKTAQLDFLDTYALEDRGMLKEQADEALAAYLKDPGIKASDRNKAMFRALAGRALMFNQEDFSRIAEQAEKLAGNDKEKRILFYQAFFAQKPIHNWSYQAEQQKLKKKFLEDKQLDDLDRALHFDAQYKFAEKEALYETVLLQKDLSDADMRTILTKTVELERSGLSRSWIAETPMRYNGIFTISSPDPVSYSKAKAAQQKLIDTFKIDNTDTKKKVQSQQALSRLYIGMLSLNYAGQQYTDVRATAEKLEKALPSLKEEWQIYTTGYRAASAYFEEDYETAYKLFKSIAVDEYRKDKNFWASIVEPYLRTCVAMEKYDEAYMLSPDINKYLIASWEFWHRTRYQRMFAELAKKCKPETVKAVAEAGKDKKKK